MEGHLLGQAGFQPITVQDVAPADHVTFQHVAGLDGGRLALEQDQTVALENAWKKKRRKKET